MRALLLLFLLLLAGAGCLAEAPDPASTPSPTTPPPTSSATGPPTTSTSRPSSGPPGGQPGAWVEEPCPSTAWIGLYVPMPILVARTPGGLAVLEWNGTGYVLRAERALPVTAYAVGREPDPAIYVASPDGEGSRLLKLDAELRELARIALPRIGTLAFRDGVVWVATPWNLTAHDAGLRETARVAIPIPHHPAMKAIDGIMVENGTAFLIDDIVMPFFLFRVDVRDPAQPTYVDRHDLASSQSPRWQWLDAAGRTWFVENIFGGREGSSVGTVAIDTVTGHHLPGPQLWRHSEPIHSGGPGPRDEGHRILASQQRLPAWAIGASGGKTWLGRIDMAGTEVHLSCRTVLPSASQAALAVDFNRIFSTSAGRLQVHGWQAHMPRTLDQPLPVDVRELQALPGSMADGT
ncbi:MAG TPA: hypothetical protein VHI93_06700 [Candidatus Thermoplasmatota archaeon]|nr:hypothetical protein [Candidatus Thermoplasmatota archaeon]